MKRSLSEVPFAALLAYSSNGKSEVAANSRKVRDGVKAGKPEMIARAMQRLKEHFDAALARYLGPEIVLIPAPRSAPLADEFAHWPARVISDALVDAGFGKLVAPWVIRTHEVPKSSASPPGERTTVDRHLETLAIEGTLFAPTQITVVDDFVTAGRMLFSTCCVVKERFPDAEVRAFALVRTRNLVPDIDHIVDPCEGTIRWDEIRSDVERMP